MTANNSMNCYYCDKIKVEAPDYIFRTAAHDLGSEAPRCSLHWRYICGKCGEPSHFMATSYCDHSGRFFCSRCSTDPRPVEGPFWAWSYYFEYGSPWTKRRYPSLDRMEFDGTHPLLRKDISQEIFTAISTEEYLHRYGEERPPWRPRQEFSDDDVRANWNLNAMRWDAYYDEDGDDNRRYQSDEPMLELLGDVQGINILDVGSGDGYLCRKLARAGAGMTGIELSDEFIRIATSREDAEKLGITYHHGSASEMDFLADASFDKAVSNYVLMDIRDYEAAIRQVFRVLKPGGTFVAVISHPSFDGRGWMCPAPDSPRREDRAAWLVDLYFLRGPHVLQWADLDPVLSFHRPLRDYWQVFTETGFVVTGFEEPSITDRGRRELPQRLVEKALRIAFSCIFRLNRPASDPTGN